MHEWFTLTFVMGAFFIGGQVYEYAALFQEGLTISSSAYGSVFFLTTGFHGLHVVGGLIAFLAVLGRSFSAKKFGAPRGDHRDRRVVLLALRRRGVDRPVRLDLPDQVTAAPDRSEKRPRPVKALIARRHHRFAPVVLLALALVLTGGVYAALSPAPGERGRSPDGDGHRHGSGALPRELRHLPRHREPPGARVSHPRSSASAPQPSTSR